jgi:hypothetical protein
MSRLARLAEREELWSNILFLIFQRVIITHNLVNLWETADSPRYRRHAGARPARRSSIWISSKAAWQRIMRIVECWLPSPKLRHPCPDWRFDVMTRGGSPVR